MAGLLTILLAGAAGSPGSAAVAAREAGTARPLLAYAAGNRIVVVDKHGTVLTRVRRGIGGFALGGRLLAKGYVTDHGARTVGYDARRGDVLFRVTQTLRIPTVLRSGRAVAFSGQGKRDPYATSLWLRNGAGHERQLIQFSFGKGAPGIPTGMTEGYVLDYSFDSAADVAAVVGGDDYAGFHYDIWVVDVRDGGYARLTTGQRSRFPAVAPGGARVAYFREKAVCGGPMPGWRAGDLVVVDTDGTHRGVVDGGDCNSYLDRPRWLSDDVLVAVQHTRRPGSDPDPLYDAQLVLVDVASGLVSDPIGATDRVGDVSVSASLARIAYTDWTQPKGFWVFRWTPGDPADPGAWVQGTTHRFDVGRVPHLRDDPTLIPSY